MQLEVMEHYTIEVSVSNWKVFSWQDMCPSAVWYPSSRDYADLVTGSTRNPKEQQMPLVREDPIYDIIYLSVYCIYI